jgi:cytochrome b involved in lipid metabolism
MNKKLAISLAASLILAGAGCAKSQPYAPAPAPAAVAPAVQPEVIAVPTPEPTPAPAAGETKKAGYTLADVTKHNTEASCWTAIRDSVYDLTPWIAKHPGGEANILKLCGKDGTALFEGKHGGQSKQEAALATFKIGDLAS